MSIQEHFEHTIKACFEALCLNGYPPEEVGRWLQSQRSIEAVRKVLGDALIASRSPATEDLSTHLDEILKFEGRDKTFVDSKKLNVSERVAGVDLVLWRGDICTLQIDSIVNAANSAMLGCFQPDHRCIDNVIHRAAGPRLREACRTLIESEKKDMEVEDWSLDTGDARITKAYSLPSRYVVHTVGPIVQSKIRGKPGKPSSKQEAQLASCYTSSLRIADEQKLESIALCCISTGLFGYPQKEAAQLALRTVRSYLIKNKDTTSLKRVVFNVFLPEDHRIYQSLFEKSDDDTAVTLGEAFGRTTEEKPAKTNNKNITLGEAFGKNKSN